MTTDTNEALDAVFRDVEARPKRRQGITGMTIEAQMRGTMCQITEYELDVLREALTAQAAKLAEAEAEIDALEQRIAELEQNLQTTADALGHAILARIEAEQ